MEPENKTKKNIGITIGVLAIAAVALATYMGDKKPSQPADTTTTQVSDTGTTPSPSPSPSSDAGTSVQVATVPVSVSGKIATSTYKDGTYTATGSYMSPGGADQIGVTITLAHDIVTDVSVTEQAGDHTSQRYQDKFVSGYKTYVVGKNIAAIHLTKVSGSSLTPAGFNDAVAQIEAQAKA